ALARYLPNGGLDTSFNGTGKKIAVTGSAKALTVDPAGNITVGAFAGQDLIVFRHKPNGDPDLTFGTGGRVPTRITAGDTVSDVLLQPDGKLVVTAYAITSGSPGIAFSRYTETGAPDTTFNGTGRQFYTTDRPYNHRQAVLQPDGKIISVGMCRG